MILQLLKGDPHITKIKDINYKYSCICSQCLPQDCVKEEGLENFIIVHLVLLMYLGHMHVVTMEGLILEWSRINMHHLHHNNTKRKEANCSLKYDE